jgi:hypothetical protein
MMMAPEPEALAIDGCGNLSSAVCILIERLVSETPERRFIERLVSLLTREELIAESIINQIAQGVGTVGSLSVGGPEFQKWRPASDRSQNLASSLEGCGVVKDASVGESLPAIRVVLVGEARDCDERSTSVEAHPWTPLVLLAYQGIDESALNVLEPNLSQRYMGAQLVWVDLSDPTTSKTHPLWPYGRRDGSRRPLKVVATDGSISPKLAERLGGKFEIVVAGFAREARESTSIESGSQRCSEVSGRSLATIGTGSFYSQFALRSSARSC